MEWSGPALMDATEDYYEILCVSPDAGLDEITASYRKLVRTFAADKERFEAITEAYMALADPVGRKEYDARRARPGKPETIAAPASAAKASSGTVRCTCCGADNPRGQHYCGECGLVLTPPAAEGSGAPKLGIARLVLPDPDPALTFERGDFLIGRAPVCDAVILKDPYVSQQHARVRGEMGIFSIEDIGSRNGTFINGERLAAGRPHKLADGDVITVGRTQLHFEIR